jgi:RNA polymerase sigma factor (TIGR02999 family)
MSERPPPQVTQLLSRWAEEGPAALHALMPAVYQELRRLARHHLADRQAGESLQPTGLVNEAYLHLQACAPAVFVNRHQFYAFASRLLRHILVDGLRRRGRQKRGGDRPAIDFSENLASPARLPGPELLIDLDRALEKLEELAPEQARVVELRFFAGLTQLEISEVLDLSVATVERHWAAGKRRLARYLAG